jgi:molybdopterin/thiamine biosynthesis adenylyltransferase
MATKRKTADASAGNENVFTLSNGQQITLPPHDEFYAQFITRNQGLISPQEQERLRTAAILVAGCGSVGGAVIEPLIRLGAERLALAEPGEYDLPNINRQSVRLQDIGRNKAEVFRERMADINPYASVTVHTDGITPENAPALVGQADLIMDGVDVTTKPPLKAKFALHQEARRRKLPVIAGYDIAGLQMLLVYDYRRDDTKLLNGKVTESEIDEIEPMDFLARVIPKIAIPYEILPELGRQIRGEREGFPQIVYTAHLFGVLASRAAIDVLMDNPVRKRIMVDVTALMRPPATKLRVQASRIVEMIKLNQEFKRTRREKGDS